MANGRAPTRDRRRVIYANNTMININPLRPSDEYMRRKLIIIALDNSLSPERRQDIFWTSVEILLIGQLGKNVNEMVIELQTFSFK